MKKISTIVIIVCALIISAKTFAQNANTSLSNLTKTQVNRNLDPKKPGTYNLGASDSGWHSLYLTGSIYIDKQRFITNPGAYNNFFGTNAGKSTTGFYNTATGYWSMYNNTTGYYNTANGYLTLFSNTTGYYNTASGAYALNNNTSGNYNTASGYTSMINNTTGINNSAYGGFSLSQNTTGYNNTAIGRDGLYGNTIGNNNSGIGLDALYYNQAGSCNTAVGNFALNYNNDSYNTAVGYYALKLTTTSEYNTAVGYNAGNAYNNGYNNVFVGANTDVNGDGYYNVVAIGQGTICTDVNQVRLGNSSTTSIGGWANWTNVSDGRVKKNIKQNVPGLAFINKLKPVTYNLNLDAADKIIQYVRKDSTGKVIPLSKIEQQARIAKEKIIYSGFIAQDVETAAKSLNYDFSGVDAAKNNKSLYGLRYSDFVVPLVKAVQELSKMNDEKDSVINSLETRLSKLEVMMNANQSAVSNQQSANILSASLQQNSPNPFSNTTIINYSLPKIYSSAKIIITDNKGVALKQIDLNVKGNGSVKIDAATLSSGAYQYTLYVDGRKIDTKQMISSK